ncbi:MAG TPA: ABC transporter substrate-binding protein, partial [Rectinemataceae bacterium]
GDYEAILLEQAVQVNPIFSTHYWYFDCSQQPYSDARVRRALALLLPWQEIRDPELYMVPAETLVLSLPGYASAKGIEKASPEEAKRLLSQAGYPGGAGLPRMTIRYADGNSGRRIAQIMEKAWKEALSLDVILEPIAPSRYYENLASLRASGSIGIAHSTWIGDFADPEAFLQMWKSDSSLNDARLKDAAFDALLEKSYAKEGRERLRLLAEAETLLLEGAAVLPIYHSFAASVIDTDYIEGWFQNALDIHPYKYLRFGTPSIGPNVASAGTGGGDRISSSADGATVAKTTGTGFQIAGRF